MSTEPRVRQGVGLVIGKSLQDSWGTEENSDTPAKASADFLPFLRGKTLPNEPSPEETAWRRVLIVINLHDWPPLSSLQETFFTL